MVAGINRLKLGLPSAFIKHSSDSRRRLLSFSLVSTCQWATSTPATGEPRSPAFSSRGKARSIFRTFNFLRRSILLTNDNCTLTCVTRHPTLVFPW
ncbi:unnamed protein product [Ixodes persulcatus]